MALVTQAGEFASEEDAKRAYEELRAFRDAFAAYADTDPDGHKVADDWVPPPVAAFGARHGVEWALGPEHNILIRGGPAAIDVRRAGRLVLVAGDGFDLGGSSFREVFRQLGAVVHRSVGLRGGAEPEVPDHVRVRVSDAATRAREWMDVLLSDGSVAEHDIAFLDAETAARSRDSSGWMKGPNGETILVVDGEWFERSFSLILESGSPKTIVCARDQWSLDAFVNDFEPDEDPRFVRFGLDELPRRFVMEGAEFRTVDEAKHALEELQQLRSALVDFERTDRDPYAQDRVPPPLVEFGARHGVAWPIERRSLFLVRGGFGEIELYRAGRIVLVCGEAVSCGGSFELGGAPLREVFVKLGATTTRARGTSTTRETDGPSLIRMRVPDAEVRAREFAEFLVEEERIEGREIGFLDAETAARSRDERGWLKGNAAERLLIVDGECLAGPFVLVLEGEHPKTLVFLEDAWSILDLLSELKTREDPTFVRVGWGDPPSDA